MDDNNTNINSTGNNKNLHSTWLLNGFGEEVQPSKGPFTKAETETIQNAINHYCSRKNIDPSDLYSKDDVKNYKEIHKGAWLEIAQSVPHRSVQTIYRKGMRIVHPFKRGPWTEEESTRLMMLVQRHGKKWSKIQQIMDRSAQSCYDRYREFHQDFDRGRWTDEENKVLMNVVKEYLGSGVGDNVDRYQDLSIQELVQLVEDNGIVIPWSTLCNKVGRTRLACSVHWKRIITKKKFPNNQNKKSSSSSSSPRKRTKRTSSHKGPANDEHSDAHDSDNDNDDNNDDETKNISFYDHKMLEHLYKSKYTNASRVPWKSIHHAYCTSTSDRWDELVDSWICQHDDDYDFMDRPIWEMAKTMLSAFKQNSSDKRGTKAKQSFQKSYDSDDDDDDDDMKSVDEEAEIAARTVEAVNLPEVDEDWM